MAKNILVLSASPRRGGNSDTLCDSFIEGSRAAGNTAEKIFLRDKTIAYCSGCGACNARGTACTQQDDMGEILDKMLAADVIVMATPVYFYSMNGQMKTLIDRTCARYTELSNKEFYFIMTSADGDPSCMDATLEGFRAFTSCLTGAREKGVIYGVGAWQVGEIQGTKAMEEAFRMGHRA